LRKIEAEKATAFAASAAIQSPEQHFGFRIGGDKRLVRWDKIVE